MREGEARVWGSPPLTFAARNGFLGRVAGDSILLNKFRSRKPKKGILWSFNRTNEFGAVTGKQALVELPNSRNVGQNLAKPSLLLLMPKKRIEELHTRAAAGRGAGQLQNTSSSVLGG